MWIGCATVAGLMLLLVVGGGVGGYFYLKGQITHYTSETPEKIPEVKYSEEQQISVQERVETFRSSLDKDNADAPLVLSAEELNALISENKDLKGRVFLRLDEGKASADVSFPTDAFPMGKGRYFNGSVSVKVILQNGVLIVTLDEAEVNGEKVPEEILKQMRGQNLAKDAYKDAATASVISKIDKVVIEKDQITIVPRKPSQDAPVESPVKNSDEPQTDSDEPEVNSEAQNATTEKASGEL